jgi:hypothetical protein
MRRFIELLLMLVGIACSLPALAGYVFASIDYPGQADTQVFGVNSSGQVVGNGLDAGGVPFSYDSKKGSYTSIAPAAGYVATGVIGISESGAMVGGVTDAAGDEIGFVRSKNGVFAFFADPDCADSQARAINNSGLVSGFGYGGCSASDSEGFIYDSASNTLTLFLPSPQTIVHGVNSQGQVVGSVPLGAGVACTGCPAGTYGFLRAAKGAITYFRVNGEDTTARGITDSGLVTGAVSGMGYVTTLAGLPYESIGIPAAQLLAYPGALTTTPEGITNAGDIVGIWSDAAGDLHGFIATKN